MPISSGDSAGSSMTNEITPALFRALPTMRRPGMAASFSVACFEQQFFVRDEIGEADGKNIVDRGGEADGAGDIRSAGFEFVGKAGVLCFLEGDGFDHVAAALPGGHLFEQFAPSHRGADAGGAVELVAGEGSRNRSRSAARRWDDGRPTGRRRSTLWRRRAWAQFDDAIHVIDRA